MPVLRRHLLFVMFGLFEDFDIGFNFVKKSLDIWSKLR